MIVKKKIIIKIIKKLKIINKIRIIIIITEK